MSQGKNNIVSLSGGKDSTYLALTEPGELLFFDTGLDFPEMATHLTDLQNHLGKEITSVGHHKDFKDLLLYRYGWPSRGNTWCKRKKIDALKKYSRGRTELIGFSKEEIHRCNSKEFKNRDVRFPMIERGITGDHALKYCRTKGFDWSGLYAPGRFERVSCFCCPNKRIGELRVLRNYHPDLWGQMLEWETIMKNNGVYHGFHKDIGIHDYDRRFAEEDRQMDLFPEMEAL